MRTRQAGSSAVKTSTKSLAAFGVGAAALLVLAGCSGNSDNNSSSTAAAPSSSSSLTPSSGPVKSSSAPSTPSPAPSSTPAPKPQAGGICTGGQLASSIQNQGGAAGSTILQLTVKNTANTDCKLDGYPGVSMVGDGNGTQIGAGADRDPSKPSQGPTDLQPGGTASLMMKVANPGNFPTCNQHPVDGFRVYPPSAYDSFYVPFPTNGCGNPKDVLIQIGAFQR